MSLLDVFPTRCITRNEELKTLSHIANLKAFLVQYAAPFIPHLNAQHIISFQQVEEISDLLTQNMERNFIDCHQTKECRPFPWSRIERVLRRPLLKERRNTDLRMSFRWKNIFLTKSYFTFGFRTTAEEEVHLYQTTAAPLVYYKVSSSNNIQDRSFRRKDEKQVEPFILRPFSYYVVPPKTQYLILTTQKSLFLLDRCSTTLWEHMPFQTSYPGQLPNSLDERWKEPPSRLVQFLNDTEKNLRKRVHQEVITIEEEEENGLPIKKRSKYRQPDAMDFGSRQEPVDLSSSSPDRLPTQTSSQKISQEPMKENVSSSSPIPKSPTQEPIEENISSQPWEDFMDLDSLADKTEKEESWVEEFFDQLNAEANKLLWDCVSEIISS